MDKKLGRLELVMLHVSPRQIADGGIGLPRPRIDIHAQASLKVPRSGSPLHRIILKCDHALDAMAHCKVIVICRQMRQGIRMRAEAIVRSIL